MEIPIFPLSSFLFFLSVRSPFIFLQKHRTIAIFRLRVKTTFCKKTFATTFVVRLYGGNCALEMFPAPCILLLNPELDRRSARTRSHRQSEDAVYDFENSVRNSSLSQNNSTFIDEPEGRRAYLTDEAAAAFDLFERVGSWRRSREYYG
ncbi:hypothetical protein L596_022185 [Steinernema carpocapsae]|uniref:Uncharacterized protein n=1 Tax=Steinernema carpocapsae TaxID=34508 RepID=A0A4V6A055_STECR|nr:hypothetical protein L596_022185 [Steinernema carpocapsae]